MNTTPDHLPPDSDQPHVVGAFAAATAVRRVSADGPHFRYAAEVVPGWDIAGNANGGYLVAIAARAMADATERPPLSITAHYLAPGRPGPGVVEVEVVRAGRRTATATARLVVNDVVCLVVVGTFADQTPGGPGEVVLQPPQLPSIDDCVRTGPPDVDNSGFGDRVVALMDPTDLGFRDGTPSGRASVSGYFDLVDHEPIDAFGLLLAADTFAPVIFNLGQIPVSWAPTLEFTVHIRGVPAPGPVRCHFYGDVVKDGFFDENGVIWDSTGQVVAMSRQLALIPR